MDLYLPVCIDFDIAIRFVGAYKGNLVSNKSLDALYENFVIDQNQIDAVSEADVVGNIYKNYVSVINFWSHRVPGCCDYFDGF